MTALVLRGGGVEDIAAAVTEVLGGAPAGPGRRRPPARPSVGALGAAPAPAPDRRGRRRVARTERPQRAPRADWWVAAVVAGAENLGALVLRRRPSDLVDADQRILERAALVTALLLLFRRTVAEAEGRVRGELLDDLIARPVRDAGRPAHPGRAGSASTWTPRTSSWPSATTAPPAGRGSGRRRGRTTYAATRGGLAAARDGHVVLLLPGDDAGRAARAVARDLGRLLGRPVTAGAAGPRAGPAGVAAAYRDADRCVDRAAPRSAAAATGASTAELGFVGLLLGADGRDVDAASSARTHRPGRSTTTPGAAPPWSRRWRRTSASAAARPAPRSCCTSTSTR